MNESSGYTLDFVIPQGPTGPAGPSLPITNAAFMIHDEGSNMINSGSPILFSNIDLENNITYNPNTGEITIIHPGQYMVCWWLNARNPDMSLSYPSFPITITLNQLTPTAKVIATSVSFQKTIGGSTVQINGNAVFEATAGSTFSFINSSEHEIELILNSQCSSTVSIIRNAS